MLLDDSKSSLNEIKASHTKNETAYCNGHINNLPTLDQYLVESAEVKLSSRISQTSDIYVSSSPIRPDSPWLPEVIYYTHINTHAIIAIAAVFLRIIKE